MSWLDTLRPASFKGIAFHVVGTEKAYGKRIVPHEYPLRDRPNHEEMGLGRRGFTVEAFVVGADAPQRAAALEAIVESRGRGTLIHPSYGAVQVMAMGGRTRWSGAEGRVARFLLDFEESAPAGAPTSILDTIASVLGGSSTMLSAIVSAAGAALQFAGWPGFVADGGLAAVQSAGGLVTSALSASGLIDAAAGLGPVVSAFGLPAGTIPAVASAVSTLPAGNLMAGGGVPASLAALVSAPGAISLPVAGMFDRPDRQVAVVEAMLSMTGFSVPSLPPTTPDLAAIAGNAEAIGLTVRAAATAGAMEAAAATAFDSRAQALGYGDRVADVLETLSDDAGAAGWDGAWAAITDVRSAWSAHVARAAGALPDVMTVRPATTLPTSLLAYQLDGDALSSVFSRGLTIARRNSLRHPGFVPAARPVEVLANG